MSSVSFAAFLTLSKDSTLATFFTTITNPMRMSSDSILDFGIDLLVFILFESDIRVQDQHVNMSLCPSRFVYSMHYSLSFFFQQLTGERKQMAKAMAAANKTSKSSFKKRSSTPSSSAPPPKRRSFASDKGVVCYNCQQPGHISPRCPSRPNAASTPAAKPQPKK